MRHTLMAAALALLPLATAPAVQAGTLEDVRARGSLNCGVFGRLPGFSAPDASGTMRGLDADYCRAVAAAVLGDATRVRFVEQATPNDGMAALGAGSIDILARNVTLTLSRDGTQPVTPVGILFHDGQGFLVAADGKTNSAQQLGGKRICFTEAGGISAAGELQSYAARQGLHFTEVKLPDAGALVAAFKAGQCDAMAGDMSQLAARRVTEFPQPESVMLLPEAISREPLGPLVRQGDEAWRQVAFWVLQALVETEEREITSASLAASLQSSDPVARRLLGLTPGIGTPIGLADDWVLQVVRQVGNYGELYSRSLGAGSAIGLERGINALWLQGGLLYPLPLR